MVETTTVEQAEAWREYLEATEDLPDYRYEEIEDWAWARLQRRLKKEKTDSPKQRVA